MKIQRSEPGDNMKEYHSTNPELTGREVRDSCPLRASILSAPSLHLCMEAIICMLTSYTFVLKPVGLNFYRTTWLNLTSQLKSSRCQAPPGNRMPKSLQELSTDLSCRYVLPTAAIILGNMWKRWRLRALCNHRFTLGLVRWESEQGVYSRNVPHLWASKQQLNIVRNLKNLTNLPPLFNMTRASFSSVL